MNKNVKRVCFIIGFILAVLLIKEMLPEWISGYAYKYDNALSPEAIEFCKTVDIKTFGKSPDEIALTLSNKYGNFSKVKIQLASGSTLTKIEDIKKESKKALHAYALLSGNPYAEFPLDDDDLSYLQDQRSRYDHYEVDLWTKNDKKILVRGNNSGFSNINTFDFFLLLKNLGICVLALAVVFFGPLIFVKLALLAATSGIGSLTVKWWSNQSRSFRLSCFATAVWAATSFLYMQIFLSLNEEKIISRYLFVMFVPPLLIGAGKYGYEKWVK